MNHFCPPLKTAPQHSPFELILRLAALLARHDPIPFIIKLTRTYNPEVWEILEKWGIGRLPVQLERERQFINIYRGHDRARKLSDDDFPTRAGVYPIRL